MTEIHGPPGTETDRSESVRDLQFFLDPGPVRADSIFNLFGPGPCWSEIFSVLVLDFLNFLSRGPVLGLDPRPTGFGLWIPVSVTKPKFKHMIIK